MRGRNTTLQSEHPACLPPCFQPACLSLFRGSTVLHTYCRGSKICWSFDFFAAALWTEKAGAPGGAQSSSPYPGCPLRAVHSPRWGVGRVEALLPAGCSQTHLCPQGMNNFAVSWRLSRRHQQKAHTGEVPPDHSAPISYLEQTICHPVFTSGPNREKRCLSQMCLVLRVALVSAW